MTVCNFFLQGRCRYGDKCWNEHPRGGGGGGGGYNNSSYSRSSAQQPQHRGGGGGGGGFGNRVWVNPSQQKGSSIQPSSFSSHGSSDWGRRGGGGGGGGGNNWGRGGGDGGRRDNIKSTEFSFSSQNRFSSLGTSDTFDRRGREGGQQVVAGDEDDDSKLEIIQKDMEVWESSGQWGFSCYFSFLRSLSGFTDLSPEELRLEYYTSRAAGDLQGYMNGVNQLLHHWRIRVQELKIMNPSTRRAVLAELNDRTPPAPSGGFGAEPSGFGSSASSGFGGKGFGAPGPVQSSSFSFAAAGGGFGSSPAPVPGTGFGSAAAAPTQPPSGFGSSSALLASSAAPFGAPASAVPAAPVVFGAASGFSFSTTANTGGGFGSGFGSAAGSGSVFGQKDGGFGTGSPSAPSGDKSAAGGASVLFSPEDKLTPEELDQFKAKRFTLGQIPLKPPPAHMLAT